jgi:hypothetical protein
MCTVWHPHFEVLSLLYLIGRKIIIEDTLYDIFVIELFILNFII